MNLQEMETARRLNSNLVMMVWEDKAFGLISWKQEDSYGRHTDLSFGNPDWLELASAFRWQGAHVKIQTNSERSSNLLSRPQVQAC